MVWSRYGTFEWARKGNPFSLCRNQYDSGPYSANAVTFDKSSTFLAVASDEGVVKLFNDTTNKLEHTLKGHEDAVQDVAFDFNSKMIVSCGSDSTFRIWQ